MRATALVSCLCVCERECVCVREREGVCVCVFFVRVCVWGYMQKCTRLSHQRVAVCCRVLPGVAGCCSVLQDKKWAG